MLFKLSLLALAGAAGTLSRYGLQYFAQAWSVKVTGWSFPWGTLLINAMGCFLFGLIWALADHSQHGKAMISSELRLVILVGFLGAFTTFSTFGFESLELIQAKRYAVAGLNLVLQNGLGIALALVGIRLGGVFAARLWGA